MKFAKAVLFLSLIASANTHAAVTTGELPAGTTNCAATLDKETAEKQAQTKVEVSRVYAENTSSARTQSTSGASKAGR